MAGKKTFKTEVSDLLHLIIHSLYSHKEIFLRELISNASDALDKFKYRTLVGEASSKDELAIDISFDSGDVKKLVISDNGIGMTDEELETNLGTIAHSGTKEFVTALSADSKASASDLIGQFGVGFYSVFMVADKVEVISKSCKGDKAFKWTSDGRKSYSIEPAERAKNGTDIIVYLNDDGVEFATRWRLQGLIKDYSNHIAFPIYLSYEETKYNDKGEPDGKETKREKINSASALWTRNKKDITETEYNDFYKNITGDFDDPLFCIHTKAEGTLEYTTLFFIPKNAPSNMFMATYRSGVKLYVRRVYIMDDENELLPTYLRFVKGVIDSSDLPLNVSREMLQENRVLYSIRSASVKKILSELKKLDEEKPDVFAQFVGQYNRVLKEGLYQDYQNRDDLLAVIKFGHLNGDAMISIPEYRKNMKEGQKSIYYICGKNVESLRMSPLVSFYREKGMDVLFMTDDFDDIALTGVQEYDKIPLKAINRSDAADDFMSEDEKKKKDENKDAADPELEKMKKALGDRVKKVVASDRLSDVSAQVLFDSDAPASGMRRLLELMGQKAGDKIVPILEVNKADEFIRRILESDDEDFVKDASSVLLEDALLREGIMPENPAEFSKAFHRIVVGK